jgi:hypothetical protein
VSEQPRFDLFRFKWLAQQWVFKKVDLPDAQIIRRPPIAIHLVEHVGRKRTFGHWGSFFVFAVGSNRGRQIDIENKSR